MTRLIVAVLVVVPLLLLIAGLYIVVATPNVITESIAVRESHTEGFALLVASIFGFALLGILFVKGES